MPDDIAEIRHPGYAVVAILLILIVILSVVMTHLINREVEQSDSPTPFPEINNQTVEVTESAGENPTLVPT